mgnify:CR=1 FL=1
MKIKMDDQTLFRLKRMATNNTTGYGLASDMRLLAQILLALSGKTIEKEAVPQAGRNVQNSESSGR